MKNTLGFTSYGLLKLATVLTAVGLLTACGSGGSNSGQVQVKSPINGNIPPTGQLPANSGTASPITKSLVSNFAHPSYLPENVIDGNVTTFMTTQGNLQHGDIRTISIELEEKSLVKSIELVNNFTNQYNLGDLEISISEDSTNGLDGVWSVVTSVTANNNSFVSGDGTVEINRQNVKWLKLRMLYTGTGAYGPVSPAFYLSEVIFH